MPLRSRRFSGNFRLENAANNSPPMRKGETGEAVKIVQQAFVDLGFPMPITTDKGNKPPDGIFGNETFSTVSKFQSQQGLSVDGVAGRDTIGRLDQIFFEDDTDECEPPDPRDWGCATARRGRR